MIIHMKVITELHVYFSVYGYREIKNGPCVIVPISAGRTARDPASSTLQELWQLQQGSDHAFLHQSLYPPTRLSPPAPAPLLL